MLPCAASAVRILWNFFGLLWLSGEGGGQCDGRPMQKNACACGARRAPGECLDRCVDCSAHAKRQGLRIVQAHRGCVWYVRSEVEGGARPPCPLPLSPNYKSRLVRSFLLDKRYPVCTTPRHASAAHTRCITKTKTVGLQKVNPTVLVARCFASCCQLESMADPSS